LKDGVSSVPVVPARDDDIASITRTAQMKAARGR